MLRLSLLVLTLAERLQTTAGSPTTYSNPILSGDHPDPGVLEHAVDGVYYVVTTSGDAADAYPIASSSDLASWTVVNHVFPSGRWPRWAASDFWAPELHRINSSQYNVYFAARTAAGVLSVGVAWAVHPVGPFSDIGAPLFGEPVMGNIDPTFFRDPVSQQVYLVWKRDGNAVGQDTPIFLQSLAPDGLALTGTRTRLLNVTLPFEGPLVEAPWLIYSSIRKFYYLFYSANGYGGDKYCVSVARARAVTGPYEKYGRPILQTNFSASPEVFPSPGHCSVIPSEAGPDQWIMIYHAWSADHSVRDMMMDKVIWSPDEWPLISSGVPSTTPQPLPAQ